VWLQSWQRHSGAGCFFSVIGIPTLSFAEAVAEAAPARQTAAGRAWFPAAENLPTGSPAG
jgi:hypothetical protein